MKASDRAVLLGLLILGIGAAFWFMLLAPKREEASSLQAEIADVQTQVDAERATIALAEAARDSYESNYRTVVALGKAVPADADSPSLIAQIQGLAEETGIEFRALVLASEGAPPATPAATETTTDQNTEAESSGDEAEAPATAAAPATETTAASLPLGASVGPAGLAVMPYQLTFNGDFFEMADFLARLDRLVGQGKNALQVGGRLTTVNGFGLELLDEPPSTELEMNMTLNTYVTPADQGLTAGATPTTPPATDAAPTPVAAPAGTVAP